MESSINDRIGLLVKELKLSTHAFSKSIGKSSSGISVIIEGRGKPSFEVMDAICETYPNVNPTWLLRGEGEMFVQAETLPMRTAPDQYLTDHVKQLEESFKRLAEQLEVKDRQIQNKDQQLEGLQQTIKVLLGKYDLSEYVTCRVISLLDYKVPA